MKLLEIARIEWAVLGVLDHREHCQILEFLDQLDPSYNVVRLAMLDILRKKVPQYGPDPLMKTDMAKPLSEGLFEFRKQPRKGPKLRVIWFYGSGRVGQKQRVVCAKAFLKDTKRTPDSELVNSKALKDEYLRCALEGNLEIVDIDGRRINS